MKTWGPADPNIFFWKSSSDIILLWWFAFILSILRCCADIRFTPLLFSFWWPMFKSCWNSISFYYWFWASKQSSIKWALQSLVEFIGSVKSDQVFFTALVQSLAYIIGPLTKINSVFASIGVTSTTAMQQCSIIKNINHKILYWLFKTDQKLRGHVVKSCNQDLRSCYAVSRF